MVDTVQKKSRIPDFASIEEAAEFWDTHDSGEFEDEFEPVEFEVAPDFKSVWVVEALVDRPTWLRLHDHARARGVPLADLAREWILAGYARETGSPAETDASSTDSPAP